MNRKHLDSKRKKIVPDSMLLWIILFALSLLSLSLFALFTHFAPTVSTKARVTDAPESTRPPKATLDTYPLQVWQEEKVPLSTPTR
jgi:hypothetical protein